MAKKTGAVKKKRNARARGAKEVSDTQPDQQDQSTANPKPEVPAQQGGLRSLLRLVKKDKKEEEQNSEVPVKREKTPVKRKGGAQKKDAHPTRAKDKPKKGFFHGTVKFFQSVWGELKKVHWPTRSEIAVYTMVVIGSVFFVSLLIWIADSILSRLVALLLRL